MKKFTFVLAVMLIASFAIAQRGFLPRVYDLEKSTTVHKATQVQQNTKAPGDIIWSEDFDEAVWGATSSNGNPVPSNAPDGYTLVDDTDNGYHWRWSNVGPRGAYTGGCELPAEDPLASETAENGFIMMEADWYNTTDECLLADPYVSHDAYFEYGTIDMSANANVLLVFNQFSRFCCGYGADANSFFEISVDGGTTWEQIDVSPTDINVGTTNPFVSEIDLTSIAGSQASVMFRFHLIGLSHYHWEIDDIKFVEPYEYDLRLTDYWNDYVYDMLADEAWDESDVQDTYRFFGGFYNQPWFVIHPHVNYKGAVENFGSMARTNVVYNVDVYRNGEFLVKHSSDALNLEPGTGDTIEVNFANSADPVEGQYYEIMNDTAWKMYQKGMYETVLYSTADNTDDRNDNDTLKRQYMIGDGSISYVRMDTAYINGRLDPSNWTDYQGNGDGVGIHLDLPAPSVYDEESASPYYLLSSVTTFIPRQDDEALALMANEEAQLIAKMYVWNDETEAYDPFISSSPYTLSQDDTLTFVTIPFILDGFSEYLYEGGDYRLALEFYGTYETDRLHTFEIGEDNDRKTPDPWSLQLWLAADWGWSSGGPCIALNMTYSGSELYPYPDGIGSAIQNVDFEVYPNPTNGQFTIDVDGQANVTIINAIGSVVDSFQVTGKQTVNSDLQAGVYFVRVNANGQIGTKQIVVE